MASCRAQIMLKLFLLLIVCDVLIVANGLSTKPDPRQKHRKQEVKLQKVGSPVTRRGAILAGGASALASWSTLVFPSSSTNNAWGATANVDEPSSFATAIDTNAAAFPTERRDLLEAIAKPEGTVSESEVAELIRRLEPLDPSKGTGATSTALEGTWELIYSVNAKAFSPLLELPPPIRPKSLQLLGDNAASVLKGEKGRVAQVLSFGGGPSFVLSSGAVPVSSDASTLEIFPPFRFELRPAGFQRGNISYKVVDSGSDADFRALNARTEDAQAAPRNRYKQWYLETTGNPGDLRISEVVSGDPVIVGAVFVHRRL